MTGAAKNATEMDTWQLAAIDEGIAAADEAQVIRHQDVVAWVRSWGRADELPIPRSNKPHT